MRNLIAFFVTFIIVSGLLVGGIFVSRHFSVQAQQGNQVEIPEHTHSFNEWKIVDYPTLENEGSEERTCACGEKEIRKIEKLDKKYIGHWYVKNSEKYLCFKVTETEFCLSGAYLENDILYTFDVYETYEILDLKLDCMVLNFTLKVNDKAIVGLAEYDYISDKLSVAIRSDSVDEKDIFIKATKVLQHEHNFSDWQTTLEPTCTEVGSQQRVCSCGEIETRELAVIAHNYEEISVEGNKCEGIVRTLKCVDCGHENEVTILGSGHEFLINSEKIPATCTSSGYELKVCLVCDKEFKYMNEYQPALGHNYEETVVAPTCTEAGYTIHTCSRCGDTYTDSETEALGHNYEDVIVEGSTYSDCCHVTHTCLSCGYTFEEDLEHNFIVDGIVDATCTEGTKVLYNCSNCALSYVDSYNDSLGHDYVVTVVEPSCTTTGYTKHECSVCEYSYQDNSVNSLGHDFVTELVDYKLNRVPCSRCSVLTNFSQNALNGGFTYEAITSGDNSGKYRIISYSGTYSRLQINSGFGKIPVEIGADIFADDEHVEYLYVGNNIIVIDINAFRNASGLKHLSLPKSFEGTEFNFEGCPEDLIIYYHD